MSIDCIIIEDEPLALERVAGFVKKLPFLNLVATFDNALDGLSHLRTNHVDLLFLDINMDELTGIQLLQSTTIQGQVIITTAYSDYALQGFDLNVTDYLLKPYTFERFLQAVEKAEVNLKAADQAPSKSANAPVEYLFVKTENRLQKVNLKDVLYIEGMGDYRRIHMQESRIMTLQTFTEFEQLIPASVISRVHKSYMVALDKIDSVERNRISIADTIIPISKSYRKSFFELINY